MVQEKIGERTIKVLQGDITEVEADAIVNAANNHLWMGAGVAGAIKRKGGQIIEDEAIQKGPIPVGEAVVTGAGALKAKYVIHAAAMGQDLKTDATKISQATANSLLRAKELGVKSIAFPALGTGVGGFPVEEAGKIMLQITREHLKGNTTLEEVIFVLFGDQAYNAFARLLNE